MDYEVVFESDRIKYVKLSESLIDDYLNMVNDPEIACRMGHNMRPFNTEEEKEWVNIKLKENAICYSMLEKESNKFIGNIELMNIKDSKAEIGITITRDMQDKHFGTEAMIRMVEYAYNDLGLKEIYLNVFKTNLRAIKCYENAGFIEKGIGKEPEDINMVHVR